MAYLWSGTQAGGRLAPGPDELRERWRARSAETGWVMPADWWAPAVEFVLAAACDGHGLAAACARLGQARGRAGVGIAETLGDLGALFTELRWPHPPLALVRCTAEGWAESGLLPPAGTCEDPLTGLMTPAYLRSRLAELYRTAAAPGGHVLVMVDLPENTEPWQRLARAVVVGHDLRTVFTGGETLSLVGTGRVVALAPAGPGLGRAVAGARELLARTLEGEDLEVWVERLPCDLTVALALLELPAGG
ncbi:hypothetical protein [Actinomadura macrotermitis]|uniref:Uncharacterized protein n=1 Tax=Actinomadura macrotermitis TaxID=2585200 RepID=A0A7K0BUV0_9ACTN|nr:hypothetical protein [Actinomadura macrotermitis]MQY04941.1 hypothetical protein [Actinomadura macrotermitis]